MAGTLRCQARAIWPGEAEILRPRIEPGQRILDLACGTGEILRRVREEFDPRLAVGLDLFGGHLRQAPPPVVKGDAFQLPFPDQSFDMVLLRHLLQAIPAPVPLLKEARRVGRRIHLLAEDYAGIFLDLEDPVAENHFVDISPLFRREGTDLYQGRRAFRHLREAGFRDIEVQPLVVDTQNCDRDILAGVFHYWKVGYAATLAGLLDLPAVEVEGRFDRMIAAIRDPERYGAWLLFVLSARA